MSNIEKARNEGRNIFLRYEAQNNPQMFVAVPNARMKYSNEELLAFDEAYEKTRFEHYQKKI